MKLKLLKNRRKIFLILAVLFFHGNLISQDSQCDEQIPPSVEKLYLKGRKYKKYDYNKYLTDKSIEMLNNYYKKDFELFNYKMI